MLSWGLVVSSSGASSPGLTVQGASCPVTGSGDTFPVFVPHGGFLVFRIRRCQRLSGNSVVRAFMPATGAKPKVAKINLMDCSCLCSKVEIFHFQGFHNMLIFKKKPTLNDH